MDRLGRVCLWLSGGSDSRLLLEVMLKTGKPFGILVFQDGWTREQKKVVDAIIIRHNLQTLSYPAIQNILVSEKSDVSLVSQYAIDGYGNVAAVIRDLVDSPSRCMFDVQLAKPFLKVAPTEFDTHIIGTRSDDRHWLFKEAGMAPANEWRNGEKTFLAPLWDWTKEEVRRCLGEFGVEWQEPTEELNTGNLSCCFKCLEPGEGTVRCPKIDAEIERMQWNPERNVEMIRQQLLSSNGSS